MMRGSQLRHLKTTASCDGQSIVDTRDPQTHWELQHGLIVLRQATEYQPVPHNDTPVYYRARLTTKGWLSLATAIADYDRHRILDTVLKYRYERIRIR